VCLASFKNHCYEEDFHCHFLYSICRELCAASPWTASDSSGSTGTTSGSAASVVDGEWLMVHRWRLAGFIWELQMKEFNFQF